MLVWILIFIICAIIGYVVAKLTSGPSEGVTGKWPSLRFSIGEYTIWLHHWFYLSMVIIILIFFRISYAWLYGLFFGAIIQGLGYKDFYYLFFKTKNYPYKKI